MASWNSQPKQFTNYTPEVDSDLYGKILQKKELDYQKGIQAVEQTGQQLAASLPIANNAVRGMVQDKFNNITNELNNSTGVDFSDRAIQKATSQHIASIANDPLVLHHVAQTAMLRKEYNKAKQGAENSDGADVANQYSFNQQMSSYVNSQDPNATFKGGYVNYVDKNKKLYAFLSHLHPNETITEDTSGSGGTDKYDIVKYKVSGIDPSTIDKEVRNYLETNPDVANQVQVESQYHYKDMTPINYVQQQQQVDYATSQGLLNEKLQYELLAAKTTDSNLKTQYINKSKGLFDHYNQILNGYADGSIPMSNIEKFQNNPDTIKHDLYKQDFINGLVGLYSYSKNSVEHLGESSRKKQIENNDHNLKVQQNLRAAEEHQMKMKIWEDKMKPKDETPFYGTKTPIDPQDRNMAYSNREREVQELGNTYNQQLVEFMYNKMKKAGTDVDKYFDVKDNQISLKDGTIGDISGKPSFGDYMVKGYVDDQGVKHKGVINNWLDKADKGDYSSDEKGFKLTNSDVQTLSGMRTLGQEYDASISQITDFKKKAEQDPSTKKYANLIKDYNDHPRQVTVEGKQISFNGSDIVNYQNALTDLKTLEDNLPGKSPRTPQGSNPSAYYEQRRKIFEKYGVTEDKLNAINKDKIALNITDVQKESNQAYQKKLNDQTINAGYVFNPTQTRWTKGSIVKKDNPLTGELTDETILDNIRNHIDTKYNGDLSKVGDLGKILNEKDSNPQVDVTWNPNTRNYKVRVYDTKNNSAELQLNETEAARMGIPNIKPREDHASKLLKLYGGQTWPQGKPMNFETALPLATIGPLEFRMHIEDNGNNYIIQPYKIDTRKPGAKVETMPDIVTNTHNYDEVAKYLQKLTGQYTQKGYGNTSDLTTDQTEQLNEQ